MSEEIDARAFCPACGAGPGQECHDICQNMKRDTELIALRARVERMEKVVEATKRLEGFIGNIRYSQAPTIHGELCEQLLHLRHILASLTPEKAKSEGEV